MRNLTYTSLVVDINDQNFEKLIKIGKILKLPCIIIDDGEVLSIDNTPVDEYHTLRMINKSELLTIMALHKNSSPSCKDTSSKAVPCDTTECNEDSQSKILERPVGKLPEFVQFANVSDEPENLDKDFLKAQLSVKHQSIIRNVLAVVSSIAVAIAFLLEKLGII